MVKHEDFVKDECVVKNKKQLNVKAAVDELSIALKIAQKAHDGQKDKVGEDYIKHPVTVSSYCKTERAKIAALLHDVVEDSNITLEDLRFAGIGEDVITAVKYLTKQKKDEVGEYLNRLALNDIAVEVKFADMRHNSDKTRFCAKKQEKAEQNCRKYLERAKFLRALVGDERAKSLTTEATFKQLFDF